MNQANKDNIKNVFSLAYNAAMRFDAAVNAAFSGYRSVKEQARSRASAYKDEESAYQRDMESVTADTRAKLKAADVAFSETINGTVIPRLRKLLAEYVIATPPADLMNTLRIYREFGLKPSKMELETLLHATEGNFMAMRALQTVARETGFDLKFDDVSTYERDIIKLEKMARIPTCYGPLEYIKEVDEIFPNVPVFRPDGTVAYNVPASSTRAIINAQYFTASYKDIKEAADRWTTAIIPEISAYQPVKDEETDEEISPEQQRQADIDAAVKVSDVDNDPSLLGHKLGQQRAAEGTSADKVLAHYIKLPGGGSQ